MGSEIFSLVNKSSKHKQQTLLKKLAVVKVNDVQITMWFPLPLEETQVAMPGHVHIHTYT